MQSHPGSLKYKIITLGCPVNQSESAAMESALKNTGFFPVDDKADVYIVNSCAVTKSAARKSRKEVRQARKENPAALIIMVGCYSQLEYEKIKEELPEVDIIIGTAGRLELPQIILKHFKKTNQKKVYIQKLHREEKYEEIERISHFPRQRPVVKIQEGCDEFCTYCAVVLARGRPRSRDPENIEKEVLQLASAGHKEIVLAGTHLGKYGEDLGYINLPRLLQRLCNFDASFRIRLSSLEPMGVSEELLRVMADNPSICNYLYLPIQSGSERVLKKMGRNYTISELSSIIKVARQLMPDISIMTDIIVGFPGEREEDHKNSMETVKNIEFSRLHVFPYSPRPLTPAANFSDQVRPDVKKRRTEEMKALGEELALRFNRRFLGSKLSVLTERLVEQNGLVMGEGFSDNYIVVRFPLREIKISVGDLVTVKVRNAFSWGVEAEI